MQLLLTLLERRLSTTGLATSLFRLYSWRWRLLSKCPDLSAACCYVFLYACTIFLCCSHVLCYDGLIVAYAVCLFPGLPTFHGCYISSVNAVPSAEIPHLVKYWNVVTAQEVVDLYWAVAVRCRWPLERICSLSSRHFFDYDVWRSLSCNTRCSGIIKHDTKGGPGVK
jgi:hypothetical protein